MQNTQLQGLLQSLSATEIKRFTEYLASPFFNKKNTLTEFWNNIKKHAPDFNISDDQKKDIYELVFSRTYNDAYYRNLCSDMLQMVLAFLSVCEFENNEATFTLYKAEALRGRDLVDLHEKQVSAAEKILFTAQAKYGDKLRNRILISDMRRTNIIRRNRTKHESAGALMLDVEMNRQVMDYAIIKCLLNNINQYRASLLLGKPFDHASAENYFQIYESGLCTDDLFVRAYYLTTKLIIKKDVSVYEEAKDIILNRNTTFIHVDIENLIIALLQFVTSKAEKDSERWRQEMFDIYDYRLKNKLWVLYGELAYTSLYNTVQNALELGKAEYAENIMRDYAGFTNINIRKDITNLCNAMIAFSKGNNDEAHDLLLPIQSENILLKYGIRCLQSMIYFDNKDYLTLLSYLDSFKHFLTYNKLIFDEHTYDSQMKFCNYLNQLTKLKMDPNKKDAEKLRNDVDTNNFESKQWLLKHLDALQK